MPIGTPASAKIGIAAACIGLGVARATFYRAQHPVGVRQPRASRLASPRALSVPEQHTIRCVLLALRLERSPFPFATRRNGVGVFLSCDQKLDSFTSYFMMQVL
jgi:hypothetical protein